MKSSLGLALLCALDLACGDRAPLEGGARTIPTASGGTSGGPSAPSPAPSADSSIEGADDDGGGDVTIVPPPTPPPPPACDATCTTPFAPSGATTTADLAAALVGRWQFCSGGLEWGTWGPADIVGVELDALDGGPAFSGGDATASGDLYFLVAGPDGAPARGTGDAYHLRYDVPSSKDVVMRTSTGGMFWATARVSTCPRQLELLLMYKQTPTMHVPIADGEEPTVPPKPACASKTAISPAMSPEDFCAIFLADCPGFGGYATLDQCEGNYAAAGPNRKMCQSYHVCNADEMSGAVRQIHCGHAAGESVCTQAD